MFGVIAGLALIAFGISWRLYEKKIERQARMSRNWVVNDLPDREAEDRRRMGLARR
jgi:hypothetical protein